MSSKNNAIAQNVQEVEKCMKLRMADFCQPILNETIEKSMKQTPIYNESLIKTSNGTTSSSYDVELAIRTHNEELAIRKTQASQNQPVECHAMTWILKDAESHFILHLLQQKCLLRPLNFFFSFRPSFV